MQLLLTPYAPLQPFDNRK